MSEDDEVVGRDGDAPGSSQRLRPYEAEGGDADVFEVFVQWERGQPHEHAETVNAPDADMALTLAKRNVDLRSGPVDVWVAPRRAMRRAGSDDPALTPTTDRSYRTVRWFVDNRIDVDERFDVEGE